MEFRKIAPEGYDALSVLGSYVKKCGLEPILLELVKTRVSQINGCDYCTDRHTKIAQSLGETNERLQQLPSWHSSPLFTPREKAALEWAENVTNIASTHVPQEAYDNALKEFSQKELVNLTYAVIIINSQNRLAISFGSVRGS